MSSLLAAPVNHLDRLFDQARISNYSVTRVMLSIGNARLGAVAYAETRSDRLDRIAIPQDITALSQMLQRPRMTSLTYAPVSPLLDGIWYVSFYTDPVMFTGGGFPRVEFGRHRSADAHPPAPPNLTVPFKVFKLPVLPR